MKTLLIDHDIEGQGNFLWGTLVKDGWLSLVPIEFVNFQDVGLPFDSNDREVWRFAQANNMILLTANRNMEDETSLEQTLRDENTMTSLPVLTIGNQERIIYEISYRERCAERLIDVMLDLENYIGVGRIFIPS